MTSVAQPSGAFSIRRLRSLFLIGLALGVAVYTAVMFSAANALSKRLGPQVRVDLEWRVQRGAQELSHAADVGLAVADAAVVRKAFTAYTRSKDVQAIVALGAEGGVIAQYGHVPEAPSELTRGASGRIREGAGYLVSWAPAEIEGLEVGRVALVVSTDRLREAETLLSRASNTTLVGGLVVLLLGGLVITFFARAVILRDDQLLDYSANLERKVEQRTRELDERNLGMRLMLDNVAQGFLTVDAGGVIADERSAIVDRWFGAPPSSKRFSDYLGARAPLFAASFDVGLEQLRDDFLPRELALDQMPKRFEADQRTYEVSYAPIGEGPTLERLLVVISDVTEHLAREQAEGEQRELAAFFQHVMADRIGVEEFLTEAAKLVDAIRSESDPVVQKRLVHTLKGNCGMYGLERYAALAHEIESALAADEAGAGLSDEQRAQLVAGWKLAIGKLVTLLGAPRSNTLEIERSDLEQLAARAQLGVSSTELGAALLDLAREPLRARLRRLARHAQGLAQRLNKPAPKLAIDDHGVRLDPHGWLPFWSAMVHVVRNAVDHGIETPQSRVASGKPEAGSLELGAERRGGDLIITVHDDGQGIDFARVRAKAESMGLPHASKADLVNALFADGLSTRAEVSQVSGRGVGMGALHQAVIALGGTVEVESTPGKETTFRFRFAEQRALQIAARAVHESQSSLLPLSY